MLHIVTVHWQSVEWIAPQLSYVERNVDQPFRLYASLNGIDDGEYRDRFDFSADLEGTHAEKLNALADIAIEGADPADQLLFIDGDAFPVRPVRTWMTSILERYPLAAVRRDENLGDPQPHPCFCFTTCGFWKTLGGDWREGGTWVNSAGATVTDVGGNLYAALNEQGHDWLPMLRSNTRNVDPVWFGVYAHRVYHHGAGFRSGDSRIAHHKADVDRERTPIGGSSLRSEAERAVGRPSSLLRIRPRHARRLLDAAKVSVNRRRRKRTDRRREVGRERVRRYGEKLKLQLARDPQFFLELDDTSP
jgi:hypothetical protein